MRWLAACAVVAICGCGDFAEPQPVPFALTPYCASEEPKGEYEVHCDFEVRLPSHYPKHVPRCPSDAGPTSVASCDTSATPTCRGGVCTLPIGCVGGAEPVCTKK